MKPTDCLPAFRDGDKDILFESSRSVDGSSGSTLNKSSVLCK